MISENQYHEKRWQEIKNIWIDNRWLYAFSGFLLGIFTMPVVNLIRSTNEVTMALAPEAIGIVFTVFVIDRLASNRSREELIERLHIDLLSTSNDKVVSAIERLRYEGELDTNFVAGKKAERTNWTNVFIGGMNFQGAYMEYGIFEKATSRTINQQANPGHREEWIKADFRNTNLYKANFRNAQVSECDFRNCRASRAFFDFADMTDTRFDDAYLRNCQFVRADLYGTIFEFADISSGDFSRAYMQYPYFVGANLIGADFETAIISGEITLPNGEMTSDIDELEKFTNKQHPDFQSTLSQINEIRVKNGRDEIKHWH